jgi:putative SOS response-associated peptidase YedK
VVCAVSIVAEDRWQEAALYIRHWNDRHFGLAGLWERWDKQRTPIESVTTLARDANELMMIRERVPVIIPPNQFFDLWLDSSMRGEKEQ